MPQYSKTTWVDGSAPAISAANLNKLEQGVFDSLRQDGSTTMSAQLVTIAGTAATPAIAPTGDSNTGIFFPAADTIAFGEGGAEVVRVTSTGNVGIGHNSESQIIGQLTTHKLSSTSAQTAIAIAGALATGSSGHAILWKQHATYTTGFIACDAVSSGAGTGLIFGTANAYGSADASEKMRIMNTGLVGIGTQTPQRLLELSSATNVYNRITSTTDSVAGIEFFTNGSQKALITGDSNGISLTTTALTPISLKVNSAEHFRINILGNIAIGVGSPGTSQLHIYNNGGSASSMVETNTTGGDARIALKTNGTGGRHWYWQTGDNTSGLNGRLRLWDSTAGSERLTILDSGNVGIGTALPTSKLHISSATGSFGNSLQITNTSTASGFQSVMAFYTDNSTSNQFLIGKNNVADGASTFLSNQANSSMIFETNALERMRITSAGNVGIGTNSPTSASNVTTLCLNNTTGSNFELFANGTRTGIMTCSSTTVSLRNLTTNPLLFFTDAVERLHIESGGRTRPSANNTYELGSATFRWSTIYAQNALNTSDERLKTDIAESSLGLDFIAALNPVQFRYIEGGNTVERVQTGTEMVEVTPAIPAQPAVLDEEGNVIQEATEEVAAVTEEQPTYEEVITPREGVRTHFGLLAQEVKAALPDGLDFAGWALADKDDPESTQFLGYAELIAPMIKAIQELKAKVEALEAQLAK